MHFSNFALLSRTSKAHYKFTRWWLTLQKADRRKRDVVFESLHTRYSQPALSLVLYLRGLYVKMGQILSSRPDFMPPQYIQCFTELQDSIPPHDTTLVQSIAMKAWKKHCPAIDEYEDIVFDPVALGSASIGQVHRAILRRKTSAVLGKERSHEVAVKVMHQGAKAKFQTDFQVFRWLCRLAIPSWRGLLDALEQQVMTEFDYRKEAQSLQEVGANIRASRFRNRVCVPEPIEALCCEHVLVMEILHGKKLIDWIRDRLQGAVGGSEEQVTQFLATWPKVRLRLHQESRGSAELNFHYSMSSNHFCHHRQRRRRLARIRPRAGSRQGPIRARKTETS
jgi:aarF domain-containing kinase